MDELENEVWWNLDSEIADMAIPALNSLIAGAHCWPGELGGLKTPEDWTEVLIKIRDGFVAHRMIENMDYGHFPGDYETYLAPLDVHGIPLGHRVLFSDAMTQDAPDGVDRWEVESEWVADYPEPTFEELVAERAVLEQARDEGLALFALWFPYLND